AAACAWIAGRSAYCDLSPSPVSPSRRNETSSRWRSIVSSPRETGSSHARRASFVGSTTCFARKSLRASHRILTSNQLIFRGGGPGGMRSTNAPTGHPQPAPSSLSREDSAATTGGLSSVTRTSLDGVLRLLKRRTTGGINDYEQRLSGHR